MRKNPHAVALGRKGGQARAAALSRPERVRIAKMGGRPSVYRFAPNGALQRFQGAHWLDLEPPYDNAAKAFVRRHRRLLPVPS